MTELYHLSDYGFLKIAGPDAVKFMQGYATCDLTVLEDNGTAIGATCNIQGRMVTSFLALKTGTDLILRMHRPLVNSTIDFLKKYIVFSKAELQDISEEYVCYGALSATEISVTDGYVINLGNRCEIWTTEPLAASHDTGPWQEAEVAAGVAWVTEATAEEHLPQMFNYHSQGGIDFEKGCYLGQEIVARAQYRGELKRRLHRLSSSQPHAIGDSLDIGTVVSVSPSALLAVLKNSTEEPVIGTFEDGEAVEAVPC